MESILKGVTSAMLAYTTHYGVVKLYNRICVPDGIFGYLQGLVTTGSPVCQAGVQIVSSTQVSYSSVILLTLTRLVLDAVISTS